jgi:TolB protein
MVHGAAALGGLFVSLRSRSGWAQATDKPVLPRAVRVAVPEFDAGSVDASDIARNMTEIVMADLKSSDRLGQIDPSTAGRVAIDAVPQFGVWRDLGADALVVGRVQALGQRLHSEVRLWNVGTGQQLVGEQFICPVGEWRRVGHVISTVIYQHLVGNDRDFDSQHN